MVNKYNTTNTTTTNANNNVRIEPTKSRQHLKNNTNQNYKINTDKIKNNESSLQNNGQSRKRIPQTQY